MPYNKFSFGKPEKLCSKKLIEELFSNQGVHRIAEHPFLLLWKEAQIESDYPAQVLIIVSKKLFHKAVDRNRVRRQIRELYRLNKNSLYEVIDKKQLKIAMVLIYKESVKMDMLALKPAYERLIEKLIKNIEQNN